MKSTIKKKSDELMDIREIAAYFGLSESSIRRRVRAARNGQSNFILPLFGCGSRVLFRKADVLSWRGEDSETITFTSSQVPAVPRAAEVKSHEQVQRELQALGVRLPGQQNKESNN
jgi:hypothetical protein